LSTQHTCNKTMMSTAVSPKGPSIEVSEQASDTTPLGYNTFTTLAEEGYRAIEELERVLFFTDLDDNRTFTAYEGDMKRDNHAEKAVKAQDGIRAIHDLNHILFFAQNEAKTNHLPNTSSSWSAQQKDKDKLYSKCLPDDPKGMARANTFDLQNHLACTHLNCQMTQSKCTSPPPSVHCASLNNSDNSTGDSSCTSDSVPITIPNMMDTFKAHFQSALEGGQQAIQTVERKILFTDIDEKALARANKTGASVDIFEEMHLFLSEIEEKLATVALQGGQTAVETGAQVLIESLERGGRVIKEVEESTQKIYKECERQFLCRNLETFALAKDKTKDDVITHFLNSQQVLAELERKFLFTDLK